MIPLRSISSPQQSVRAGAGLRHRACASCKATGGDARGRHDIRAHLRQAQATVAALFLAGALLCQPACAGQGSVERDDPLVRCHAPWAARAHTLPLLLTKGSKSKSHLLFFTGRLVHRMQADQSKILSLPKNAAVSSQLLSLERCTPPTPCPCFSSLAPAASVRIFPGQNCEVDTPQGEKVVPACSTWLDFGLFSTCTS